ncbi:tetratricopeptide repeat protein [Plantactinospora siamensis]|uniref:Tetratricopeptide repeat protein n=1 Tax=Plantactinospora siamensis TaxID=555372 RepID=A0ABV6P556_9ACTN
MDTGAVPDQMGRSRNTGTSLDELLAAAPQGDRPTVLVEHFTARVLSSLSWLAELAEVVERHSLPIPEIRRVATDLAWKARMAERSYPGPAEWDRARAPGAAPTARLIVAYVHGQRLRFDYRFEQLRQASNAWLREFPDDALILGLAAYGAIGSRAPNGMDLYRRAILSPDADDKSRQLCLAGISFADHIEDAPELLLRLSDDIMARGEDNANVHYRRAMALRMLGRYDEALTDIDQAIDMFGVGDPLVHEQYSQERRAIVNTRELHRQAERLSLQLAAEISGRVEERMSQVAADLENRVADAAAEMTTRVNAAQDMLSGGLLKIVEILGLFVTLIGFLVGSGAVVLKARSVTERSISMALVVVGALVFFGLLRLVTGYRRRTSEPARWRSGSGPGRNLAP